MQDCQLKIKNVEEYFKDNIILKEYPMIQRVLRAVQKKPIWFLFNKFSFWSTKYMRTNVHLKLVSKFISTRYVVHETDST